MMTSENYSTPKKYRVEASRELYDKENNIKDTSAFKDNSMTVAYEGTDISNTENVSCDSSSTRRNRARRSRDQVSHENSQNNEEMQVEGATAVAENPKSLKKEKPSGKKRKERKNLREKRRSTGVVVMPGLGAVSMNAYKTVLFDITLISGFLTIIVLIQLHFTDIHGSVIALL